MCQCQCCCASQAPPWWVTMGFVPPTNPNGGGGHVATPVESPGTATTTPPPPTGVTIPGGHRRGTVGGTRPGNTGPTLGVSFGGIIYTVTNPLGAILGLL